MSAITEARSGDPRVVRSRAVAVEAARTLFLEQGYAGTTMDEIASLAGLSKRTLYNNYTDKAELFTEIVTDVIEYAEQFARGLSGELADVQATGLAEAVHDLGRRLALGILRPDVIALRRLLIAEGGPFPELAEAYYDRAPGCVIRALASRFEELGRTGLLRTDYPRRAAEQFAYLVVGAPLDRALLLGRPPVRDEIVAGARDGVETFLARFGPSLP